MASMKRLLEQFAYFEDEETGPVETPRAVDEPRVGAPALTQEQLDDLLRRLDPLGDTHSSSYEVVQALLGLPAPVSAGDALANVAPGVEVDPDAYIDERAGSNPEAALDAK
jgi:hypothetical protein